MKRLIPFLAPFLFPVMASAFPYFGGGGGSSGGSGAFTSLKINTVTVSSEVARKQLSFTIDGGGSTITTGAKKIYIRVPCNMTASSWELYGDQSGSVVIDVWKAAFAGFPPTVAQTIAGSGKPTMSSVTFSSGTTSGWGNTTLVAGDIVEFNVDSVTSLTKLTGVIYGLLQ